MANQTTTNIKAVWDFFFSYMGQLEGQSGPDSTLPIRAVAEGESTDDQYPIPFLEIQLIKFEAVEKTVSATVYEGLMKFRIVSQSVSSSTSISEIISKIALVSDHLDAMDPPTGMNRGFTDRKWSITHPTEPKAGGTTRAEATASFRINVGKGEN